MAWQIIHTSYLCGAGEKKNRNTINQLKNALLEHPLGSHVQSFFGSHMEVQFLVQKI